MRGELDVLIQLHLDDALDDAQAARLRELLKEPGALDALARAADLHAALADRRPLPKRVFVRRRSLGAWAAAAAVLAVAVLLLQAGRSPRPVPVPPLAENPSLPASRTKVPDPFVPAPPPESTKGPDPFVPTPPPEPGPPAPPAPEPPPPPARPAETRAAVARLDATAGAVWVEEVGAKDGQPLLAGQLVRSGDAPARAVVALPDGTRLELEARTRLRVPGPTRPGEKRVDVEEGALTVHAAPQRGEDALVVATPHASIRVTGTRFTVWTAPGATRLDVQEGRVRVRRAEGPATLDLVPGQYAVVGAGLPFTKRAGAGLKADYFESRGDRVFLERRGSRVDPDIDFNWGARPPLPAIRTPGFAVRWSGTLLARLSGEHAFHLLSECGARLWIGDRLLLDHWADHDAAEAVASLRLEAGRAYPLRLDYYACDGQTPGNARVRLAWSNPAQPKTVIPAWHLSPVER